MPQDLPGRMLRLLSLLQTRREWTGAELSERLGVTLRTIRRDIDRLRDLGYPVEATTGHHGGYRLAAGADLPPLLLDDEEAVAMAVVLATATAYGTGLTGVEDSAVRALAKLRHVLPARLRHQVDALQNATTPVSWTTGARADPAVLATLATACRDHETVTFTYTTHDGTTGPRRAEPHALVTAAGYWYLIAYDTDRTEWRTFRIDRLTEPAPTGRRTAPRELPAPDPATYLAQRIAAAPTRYTLRATVPADAAAEYARTWSLPDRVHPVDDRTSAIELAADSPHQLAAQLLRLDPTSTFEQARESAVSAESAVELAAQLEESAQLLLRAARALTGDSP
ncbi:helix-turn-helix transcriptional regulator [Streptomyces sp. NPDC059009]|uniref:helix-turn-helix transcriptional regulator n=1 Tax=Streptomyces sp. NPDC059009 TaxID=3346694 RepID=UPI00368CAA44